jgi:DNA-binding response OmpR family regulator
VPRRVLVLSEDAAIRRDIEALLLSYKFQVQVAERLLLRVVVDARPDLLVLDVPQGRSVPIVNMLQMLSLSDDTKRMPVLLLVDSVKDFKTLMGGRVLPIAKPTSEDAFLKALKTLVHVPQLG